MPRSRQIVRADQRRGERDVAGVPVDVAEWIIVVEMHRKLGSPLVARKNAHELTLDNGSRIVCLPCREETIRDYSGVTLLIIDEAARGYRNPFAAIWGYLTRDGVLVLVGEHYSRERPLSHHAMFLPKQVTWYADPSGATERAELRRAGFTVREAKNNLRPGIAAVNARIQNGTLLIKEGACPNLLAEAGLYRYSDNPIERHAEIPIDEHNHALSALRYLIMMIDAHRLTDRGTPATTAPSSPEPGRRRPRDPSLSIYNEELWTPIE